MIRSASSPINARENWVQGWPRRSKDAWNMEISVTSSIEKNRFELIEKFEAKVAANPDSPTAHMKLGTALLSANKTKKAEEALCKAIELDPECVPALINMGGIFLGRWDFKNCVEMNRRAAKIQPEALAAHYNEGLGHLYLVEKEEMVACFRRVVALDENHAGGHYHLAVGLLALGKDEEAKQFVAKALQLGFKPEPAFLRALEKKDDSKASPDINKPQEETEKNQ